MLRKKWILILGLGAACLILMIFLFWVSWTQSQLTSYEFDNYRPYGLKALQLLLKKEGYQTAKIEGPDHDYQKIIIIPSRGPLNISLTKKILAWVKAGGTLFELAESDPSLQTDFEQEVWQKTFGANYEQKKITPDGGIDWLEGLNYHPGSEFVSTVDQPQQGFFSIKGGYFIYLEEWGAGRIIHWNDFKGLTNIRLKKYPDNAVIFAMLVQEYAKSNRVGLMEISSETEILPPRPNPLTQLNRFWAGSFLVFMGIVLFLWKISARFGRPRPLVLAKGRSADEFIDSMAALFQQAGGRAVIADNLLTCLNEIIGSITGLPPGNAPEIMSLRLSALTGKDYQELFVLCAKIKNPRLSRREFLRIAICLDIYRKELLEWRKS